MAAVMETPDHGEPQDVADERTERAWGDLTVKQSKYLDIIDSLREFGFDSVLSLPQLVVCGDQSAGKSSVLEAISGIPFPTKKEFCTRFATEVVLRRGQEKSIKTRIMPGKNRTSDERIGLDQFQHNISDVKDLPRIIDMAIAAMDLGKVDESSNNGNEIGKDALRIDVTSPKTPHLTFVDLPGLIHIGDKKPHAIRELVMYYLSQPRSIILPVLDATHDVDLQEILDTIRLPAVDKPGVRTFGIVTKPDRTGRPGDRADHDTQEIKYFNLISNELERHRLALGWHVLRNLDSHERKSLKHEAQMLLREQNERLFFDDTKKIWSQLPKGQKGIQSLRQRLSVLLYEHIKNELPSLQADLKGEHWKIEKELQDLGDKRSTPGEQRAFIAKLGQEFSRLTTAAIDGRWNDSFFARATAETDLQSIAPRRLRAQVYAISSKFMKKMRQAHKHDGTFIEDSRQNGNSIGNPMIIGPGAVDRVEWILDISREIGLPGTVGPSLVGQLFTMQTKNWEGIAKSYIESISDACNEFVKLVLNHVSPRDIATSLTSRVVQPKMDQRRKDSEAELRNLIKDKERQPMTYHEGEYSDLVKDIEKQRHERERPSQNPTLAIHANHPATPRAEERTPRGTKRGHDSDERIVPNIGANERYSCGQALNSLLAFYDGQLRTFIENVTIQVGERHLVDGLAEVIPTAEMMGWDNHELAKVAEESREVAERRKRLEAKRDCLSKAIRDIENLSACGGGN